MFAEESVDVAFWEFDLNMLEAFGGGRKWRFWLMGMRCDLAFETAGGSDCGEARSFSVCGYGEGI